MKKFVLAIALMVFSFSLLVATPGEYDDIVDTMLKMEKVFISFAAGSEAMTNAADAVKVINGFKEGMIAIVPALKALEAKYPNMEDIKKNPPAEIKVINDRLEKAGQSMQTIIPAKFGPYMADPTVQTAFMELQTAMQQLQATEKAADQAATEQK